MRPIRKSMSIEQTKVVGKIGRGCNDKYQGGTYSERKRKELR